MLQFLVHHLQTLFGCRRMGAISNWSLPEASLGMCGVLWMIVSTKQFRKLLIVLWTSWLSGKPGLRMRSLGVLVLWDVNFRHCNFLSKLFVRNRLWSDFNHWRWCAPNAAPSHLRTQVVAATNLHTHLQTLPNSGAFYKQETLQCPRSNKWTSVDIWNSSLGSATLSQRRFPYFLNSPGLLPPSPSVERPALKQRFSAAPGEKRIRSHVLGQILRTIYGQKMTKMDTLGSVHQYILYIVLYISY